MNETLEIAGAPTATRNRFDRMEIAGAFGDLGTLVPFAVALPRCLENGAVWRAVRLRRFDVGLRLCLQSADASAAAHSDYDRHARDHARHRYFHSYANRAHARAHAEDFYSRSEHRGYHRALPHMHGHFTTTIRERATTITNGAGTRWDWQTPNHQPASFRPCWLPAEANR